MFSQKKFLLAIAAVALVWLPTVSEAQYRGGGRYGGNRGGGSWSGGGWGGGGWNGGFNRPGSSFYGNNWGRPGISIGLGIPFSYGAPYRNYSNSNFGGYYQSPSYYPGTTEGSVIYNSPSVTYQPSVVASPSYQSFYPPINNGGTVVSSPSQDGAASITVTVPANAELMWNGVRSTLSGDVRRFRTASLPEAGSKQTFEARWMGPDGQPVTQRREVQVTPNGTFNVSFNQRESDTAPTQERPRDKD